MRLPLAHGESIYYVPEEELKKLEQRGQLLFRYCLEDETVSQEANPNGSVGNIAGVCNDTFNVFGLMPHPERACEDLLGYHHGLLLFLRDVVSALSVGYRKPHNLTLFQLFGKGSVVVFHPQKYILADKPQVAVF